MFFFRIRENAFSTSEINWGEKMAREVEGDVEGGGGASDVWRDQTCLENA